MFVFANLSALSSSSVPAPHPMSQIVYTAQGRVRRSSNYLFIIFYGLPISYRVESPSGLGNAVKAKELRLLINHQFICLIV